MSDKAAAVHGSHVPNPSQEHVILRGKLLAGGFGHRC